MAKIVAGVATSHIPAVGAAILPLHLNFSAGRDLLPA